jgi:hypothetical protein
LSRNCPENLQKISRNCPEIVQKMSRNNYRNSLKIPKSSRNCQTNKSVVNSRNDSKNSRNSKKYSRNSKNNQKLTGSEFLPKV